MSARPLRTIALFAVLAFVSFGCMGVQKDTTSKPARSLSLGTIARSVDGNVVTLPVNITGFKIVKADGDMSGDSGHFHVFIDRKPVAVGQTIPKEKGIVHSADNPIKVWGLAPGQHEFTVVVGDGTHKRIHGNLEDSVIVDVKGPSVWGSAPKTISEGDGLKVDLMNSGVVIKKADGDTSGSSGHFHVLVDPATPPKAGDMIPPAEDGKVYHTTEASVTVTGLTKGEHIIWIVLGDGTHTAFDPPVMDKLTITVT